MSMSQQAALKKLQATELEILLVFKKWCNENNITWFIDSGTRLGAMRHQGFIPWDDDIDVGLPRKDYERLLALSKDGFPEGYSIHTSEDDGYTSLFAKMYKDETVFATDITEEAGGSQGIYIDIFPYDYLHNDVKYRVKQERKCANYQKMMHLYYLSNIKVPHAGALGKLEKLLCHVGHFLIKPFADPHRIQERFNLEAQVGSEDSNILECLSFAGYAPSIMKETLLPVSELEFEGLRVPAPHDPVRYLELMYGDWTVLPPVEERHTHLPRKIVFSDGTEWASNR